ncbi:MAG: NAD(P)/FAD-dependent oxidoreductase [Candidatus Dormibacteria bacterium]
MAVPEVHCIVGAGLAGGRAATTLRELGFDGRVVLIGDEGNPPYERPPLSKAYLLGQLARPRLLLRPEGYYSEHDIELRLDTRVVEVNPRQRLLRLQSGENLSYDRLLIATGSTARRLPLPGAGLAGVATLATVQDADHLRAHLQLRPRVVVVGAGFLGCELAASAKSLGCEVHVVELGGAPLPTMGTEMGRFVVELHRQHGVSFDFGQAPTEFRGDGRVEEVILDDGRRLACDLAMVCVGAAPNSQLAQTAGLEMAGGIAVDSRCRSSDPAVFAAGDVASFWHPGLRRRLRLEHWDNAHRQGTHAGQSMLGRPEEYSPLPYFWSEQYDAMIQQVGLLDQAQQVVVRGTPGEGSFSTLHLRDGVVVACVAVNRFPDLASARRLITAQARVEPRLLADPLTDLKALAAGLPPTD